MGNYGKGDTSWFTHDRFGMFIHWGLYSMPARHEWVRHNEKIDNETYQVYFDLFNPDLFDPKQWAKAAREAGMKYFVITTKHHEGFCLWDTKYTDYKAPNTPAGRDLLREVVDAFRAEGLRVGFYYSLIDWHHPDFTIDQIHPLWDKVDHDEFNKGRDMHRYAEYMRNQVTELLTNYGKIDVLWFDFSYPSRGKGRDDWESEKMIRLVRSLQPDIIVDNRLDLPGSGDIVTPEQFTPDRGMTDEEGNPVVWEGCQTFSGSWGYHRDETSWKSVEMCIQMLVNHVSRNGNLLMNVGPTSRGYIDQRALDRLAGYAEWMKYNSRSIYGCGAAPEEFPAPPDCRYTWNPETRRLYLHCFAWPFKHITLPNLADKVRYAQLLADGSEIRIRPRKEEALHQTAGTGELILELPVQLPTGSTVPVIELFLK
ncbi:alpha-L-fucosidase [uncultured Victivallis sp.]|uniref:alpha-L-fucosidase n=1 Tax=Victivallis sp. TaxID=2049020 RepID=UPI0025FA7558|nr:alpha-L-fucosidase [uncultured Victivallis sp.]